MDTPVESDKTDLSAEDYHALGAFRFHIRQFLHFSEVAAKAEGLEPQQHQLLLAVRALGREGDPSIRSIADYLLIQHHSAVGLIDRLVDRGLVLRIRSETDRRQVRIRLTGEGENILKRLSSIHRDELRKSGPLLVSALSDLLAQECSQN